MMSYIYISRLCFFTLHVYCKQDGGAVLIQNSGSGIFTRVLFKGNTAGHSVGSVGQTLLLLLFLHTFKYTQA